jgi:hypothetical protein
MVSRTGGGVYLNFCPAMTVKRNALGQAKHLDHGSVPYRILASRLSTANLARLTFPQASGVPRSLKPCPVKGARGRNTLLCTQTQLERGGGGRQARFAWYSHIS